MECDVEKILCEARLEMLADACEESVATAPSKNAPMWILS